MDKKNQKKTTGKDLDSGAQGFHSQWEGTKGTKGVGEQGPASKEHGRQAKQDIDNRPGMENPAKPDYIDDQNLTNRQDKHFNEREGQPIHRSSRGSDTVL